MCDQADFADGIMAYYRDHELARRHGAECCRRITGEETYMWPVVSAKLASIVRGVVTPALERHDINAVNALDIPSAELQALINLDA